MKKSYFGLKIGMAFSSPVSASEPSIMIGKILKYTLKVVSVLVAIVLLILLLLYMPFVQDFVKSEGFDYIQRKTQMHLSAERIRLSFPLKLVVDRAYAVRPDGDTLLRCERLDAHVALWPLLRKEVVVRRFVLDSTQVHYRDTASAFDLRARLDAFSLRTNRVDLGERLADIASAELTGGDIAIMLGKPETPADTVAADTTSFPWKLLAGRLKLTDIRFSMSGSFPDSMRLGVALQSGRIAQAAVDLGTQQVAVGTVYLRQGDYVFLTDTTRVSPATGDTVTPETSDTLPWIIRVDHVQITDNSLKYGSLYGVPKAGLDFSHVAVSRLNLAADSIYNRGSAVRIDVDRLSLEERSGLTVRSMKGRFGMDSARLFLTDFQLRTASSSVRADASADASVLDRSPQARLRLSLKADVNLPEIAHLFPVGDTLRNLAAGKTLRAGADLSGTLGRLRIAPAEVAVPGIASLSLDGTLVSPTEPERLSGNLRLKGLFDDLGFVTVLLPDTSLRNRVSIPKDIRLSGTLKADAGTLYPAVELAVDSGLLAVKGMLDRRTERYRAELTAERFPVGRFLPKDSLGLLGMRLEADGRGFEPLAASTAADASLEIGQFDYNGFDYSGIGLKAALRNNDLTGRISASNEALQLGLDLSGRLTERFRQVRINGRIDSCDLHRMNLTRDRLSCALSLDLTASATDSGSYTLGLATDRIEVRNKWQLDKIRPISLEAYAGRDRVEAALRSGDLRMDFFSPEGTDSLVRNLNRTSQRVAEQLQIGSLDMRPIRDSMPSLRLSLTAGPDNIVNNFLRSKGMHFDSLSVKTSTIEPKPLRMILRIDRFSSGGIVLDTITTGIWQNGSGLNYLLRLANSPGNMDNVAQIALFGRAQGNRASLNCRQRTRSGELGFDFGLNALWIDSVLTISMFPEHPTLGFEKWSVNEDNRIAYRAGGEIEADLTLTRPGQRFSLRTLPSVDSTLQALTLNIVGIDIGSTLALFPGAPPLGGRFGTNLDLRTRAAGFQIGGTLTVDSLTYDRQRIGDLEVALNYRPDSLGQNAGLSVDIDGERALAANGVYRAGSDSPLDFDVTVPGIPLAAANAFMPAGTVSLAGMLRGEAGIRGKTSDMRIDGELTFAGTNVGVPMIGTSFGLSETPIVIRDNEVLFTNFAIVSPNKKPLTIDGRISLGDFSQITTDLRMKARDFEMIDVRKNRRSMVYGTGYLDLDATVKGPLDELTVRGDAGLLNGTEITYVMRDSPLEVQNKKQDLVTFVSFRDTTAVQAADSVAPIRIGGIDMLVNVSVNSSAKLAVDLSDDGQNRIDLQGGGDLTYTMNRLGDTRFSGKYVVSGGTVRYNPPVISELVFKITQGSSVEWTGNMEDPMLNITAVETMRTNVSTEGQSSRPVNFNISIRIRNTLENLSITFDLSAPEDLAMQNELSSLTAEQRATQAMNLLIYNTYTGPGTTAKTNSSNPLNNFIEKELNQWAANSLKGVDLSFGIDSYDDEATGGRGNRTDYSYQLSKSLFNNRLKAVIGGKISSDADPDENLKENLIDDVSLEYRLTKRDNMFLKLFRHTGYESILEGEVTQTGLGFVIRKKLLKLSDLFRIMRNRVQAADSVETENPATNDAASAGDVVRKTDAAGNETTGVEEPVPVPPANEP